MIILKCTAKLQKEIGLKKADLFLLEGNDETNFHHWHANLIYIARRKCVLFVNDRTLLNFIIPDVKRDQIKKLGEMFKANLSCILSEEGIKNQYLEQILSECNDIRYSKTDSKKVLGSMNDLAFNYEVSILGAGGVHSYQVPGIIKKLNRMPMGALEYKYSIEAFNNALQGLP